MHCNASSAMLASQRSQCNALQCKVSWEGGGIDQAWARSTLAARHHQLALNYFSAPPAGCKIISRKMQLVQDYLKSTTGALVQATIASPLVPPNHQFVLKEEWIFSIHWKVELHHHQNYQIQGLTPLSPISPTIGWWACRWPGTKHATWPGTQELYFLVCVLCLCFVFACVWRSLCLCVCVWRRAAVNMQFSNSRGGDWSRCNGTDGDSS